MYGYVRMRTEEAVTAQRTVGGSAAIPPLPTPVGGLSLCRAGWSGATSRARTASEATQWGGSAATRPPTSQTDCFFAGCVSIGRVSARRERRRVPVYATERVTQLRREICRAPAKKAEARDMPRTRKKNGASCRGRTGDLLITSQLLYQLS